MNDRVLPDGKRLRLTAGFRLAGLSLVVGVATLAATAQEADIVGLLTESVRCSRSNARDDIEYNIRKLEAAPDAIGTALGVVAADARRCAPMREAATALMALYPVQPAPTAEELAATSSRKVVEQTLAEAERNAASLKFKVGPPPPRLTAERGAGPGSEP